MQGKALTFLPGYAILNPQKLMKRGVIMLNTVVETSVQTGDSRNIVLFIVLAVIALVLLVLCTVMAGAGKKNQKKSNKQDKHKRD